PKHLLQLTAVLVAMRLPIVDRLHVRQAIAGKVEDFDAKIIGQSLIGVRRLLGGWSAESGEGENGGGQKKSLHTDQHVLTGDRRQGFWGVLIRKVCWIHPLPSEGRGKTASVGRTERPISGFESAVRAA